MEVKASFFYALPESAMAFTQNPLPYPPHQGSGSILFLSASVNISTRQARRDDNRS